MGFGASTNELENYIECSICACAYLGGSPLLWLFSRDLSTTLSLDVGHRRCHSIFMPTQSGLQEQPALWADSFHCGGSISRIIRHVSVCSGRYKVSAGASQSCYYHLFEFTSGLSQLSGSYTSMLGSAFTECNARQ